MLTVCPINACCTRNKSRTVLHNCWSLFDLNLKGRLNKLSVRVCMLSPVPPLQHHGLQSTRLLCPWISQPRTLEGFPSPKINLLPVNKNNLECFSAGASYKMYRNVIEIYSYWLISAKPNLKFAKFSLHNFGIESLSA